MRRPGRTLLSVVCSFVALLGIRAPVRAGGWPAAAERRASFYAGWRFQKGAAAGAERPDFDDAGWRKLDLPHDWAIEGPFDPKISPHQGSLPFFGILRPKSVIHERDVSAAILCLTQCPRQIGPLV